MANLELSGGRFPNAESVKLTFLLTIIFYLKKAENRIQKSLTQLLQCCFE